MSFLANLLKGGLFGKRQDDRDTVRELWHRIVAIAREKAWYRDCGVADTLAGRFDLITLVLSLVMLRMEREEALIPPSVWLTELFVDDMDGQLREQGVGDQRPITAGDRLMHEPFERRTLPPPGEDQARRLDVAAGNDDRGSGPRDPRRSRGRVDDCGEATVGIGERCHRDVSHGVDSRTPARRRLTGLTQCLVGQSEACRGE
jgi:hypothetical protein